MGLILNHKDANQLRTAYAVSPLEPVGNTEADPDFNPKKAVIVSKSSLLDYELFRSKGRGFTGIDDERFIKQIARQYGNLDDLRRRHNQQQSYIKAICSELKAHGIDYRVVNRHEYSRELVKWSDLVISAGGDGTFLTAAKKVRDSTPVIGINSDPIGSEGHLCLTGKARRPAEEVIRQLLANKFRWTYRQRIRVNIIRPSSGTSSPAVDIVASNKEKEDGEAEKDPTSSASSSPSSSFPKNSRTSGMKELKFSSDSESSDTEGSDDPPLALNEVFMGESHAAKVSYYEVQVDGGALMKQKSSGMTICTGTGSTSWHYNINRLTEHNLAEILELMGQLGYNIDCEINNEAIEEICHRFNEKLVFPPDVQKMAFSIRDPVFNATFPKTISHGFAQRIRLRSRCSSADLILDGSTSIPFNRGAEVVLEIHPEDALRTVVLSPM